jgi:hypothetical protein
MKKVTRLEVRPAALLLLLMSLALLVLPKLSAVKRRDLTANARDVDAVQAVIELGGTIARNEHAAVAFLALMALFAFVIWTALRAKEGEANAVPHAQESSANGRARTVRPYPEENRRRFI